MNDAPVGIFDSGLGGLTVAGAIHSLMPSENLIYLGDSKRSPYGTKSRETIINFAFQDARFLMEKGVKAIVIACNTVSSNAVRELREAFDVPFVEVINPGARAGARAAAGGRLGVIGTSATVESGAYVREIAKIDPGLEIIQKSCPLFVPIVEEGRHMWESEIARMTARMYLEDMREKKPAALILGCTHYPLLGKTIQEAMGPGVKLIDSAQNAALQLQDILKEGLRNKNRTEGVIELYTSDSIEKFLPMGRQILGLDNLRAERVDIEKY